MAANRKKRRRVGPGGIVLGLLLALVLGGAAVAGAWWWSGNQPAPADLRPGRDIRTVELDLYAPGEPVTGEAPAAAPAPTVGEEDAVAVAAVTASDGYSYAEILAEEEGLLVVRLQGKRYKGFDVRRYGYAQLYKFVDSIPGLKVCGNSQNRKVTVE